MKRSKILSGFVFCAAAFCLAGCGSSYFERSDSDLIRSRLAQSFSGAALSVMVPDAKSYGEPVVLVTFLSAQQGAYETYRVCLSETNNRQSGCVDSFELAHDEVTIERSYKTEQGKFIPVEQKRIRHVTDQLASGPEAAIVGDSLKIATIRKVLREVFTP